MITWDEAKRALNLSKRGFGYAEDFEFETALVVEDRDAVGSSGSERSASSVIACSFWPTPSVETRSARSVFDSPLPRNDAAMPKETKPLTEAELADLAIRRAAARERARRLEPLSADEEAAIETAAASDPDARPLGEEELARLRPGHEVHPALVAETLRRSRGRPRLASPKQQVTLRLDRDIIDYYRSSGAGWQSRINEILRKAAGRG